MSLEDKITQLISAINNLKDAINTLSKQQIQYVHTDKLVPLAKWQHTHQWPTVSALRNIVYNKNYNGANSFVVKIGRRVYIDQEKFFEWAKSNPTTLSQRQTYT